MYKVGRQLGSYISHGVDTVSGPFHPFGGAVDIIVVQQQDGSFRSSPWYVKFGKFQGVLKTREKIVEIRVEGVAAGFHMYLDHKGEAYFLADIPDDSSTDDETRFKKSMICNYDASDDSSSRGNRKIVARMTSQRSRMFGLMFGGRSTKEKDQGGCVERGSSLELAEIAADLLEMRWSTNLPLAGHRTSATDDHVGEGSDLDDVEQVVGTRDKVIEICTLERGDLDDNCEVVSKSVMIESKGSDLSNCTGNVRCTGEVALLDGANAESSAVCFDVTNDEADNILKISFEGSREFKYPSECTGNGNNGVHCHDLVISSSVEDSSASHKAHTNSPSYTASEDTIANGCSAHSLLSSRAAKSRVTNREQLAFDVSQENEVNGDQSLVHVESSGSANDKNLCISDSVDDEVFSFTDIASCDVKEIVLDTPLEDGVLPVVCEEVGNISENENHEDLFERAGDRTSPINISRSKTCLEGGLVTNSLPIIRSLDHVLETPNLLHPLSCSFDFNSERYEEDLVKKKFFSSTKSQADSEVSTTNDGYIPESENERGQQATLFSTAVELSPHKNLLFEGVEADATSTVVNAEKDGKILSMDPSRAIISSAGGWKLWSFSLKKSKPVSTVRSAAESTNREKGDAALMKNQSLTEHENIHRAKSMKKKMRSPTPTSEELASLNLKEGRNMITFTFSTAMLGQQQVDARIYLWKWNTRIVISDVDGTITKSDVLGQFMPLVGIDWYQTGVAHLFSAIKENGYQILFLSARAISQAHLTRQFLFNLRQDGKPLPDGPVIISPDGLFPSLFREVIRRVPHEFKIACLENIRALFPPECNPFYAGFGNRDTDEISYLKVGIPIGKIFIINPKGEVVMNRRVDTKSYSLLQDLVHGMFPSMCSAEQEDFNSWNFWKLPIPDVDI